MSLRFASPRRLELGSGSADNIKFDCYVGRTKFYFEKGTVFQAKPFHGSHTAILQKLLKQLLKECLKNRTFKKNMSVQICEALARI